MKYGLSLEDVKDMETIYIEGNDAEFVVYIQGLGDKATLHSIDGHARWIVERENGSKVIVRPASAKN